MEKIFNLKTSERGFFKMYVEIMTVQNPIGKLRKQERTVLAEIMYQNSLLSRDYKDAEDHKKWKALFSYENKQVMAENMGDMSEASFSNCLSMLRKYKILNSDNYLHPALRIYPNEKTSLIFNFGLKDAE